jgi:hypothetical protein
MDRNNFGSQEPGKFSNAETIMTFMKGKEETFLVSVKLECEHQYVLLLSDEGKRDRVTFAKGKESKVGMRTSQEKEYVLLLSEIQSKRPTLLYRLKQI